MTTRRQFIGGVLVAATGISSSAEYVVPIAETSSAPHLPIGRVIFDARFSSARHFGNEAMRRGFQTSVVEGRVHDVWYRDLFFRWRDGRLPTAGLTDARTLFLLEMMAKDANMRVIHRIHHTKVDGASRHRVFGFLAQRRRLVEKIGSGEQHWSANAADIVLKWPNAWRFSSSTESDIQKARLHALDSQALVSWIIC